MLGHALCRAVMLLHEDAIRSATISKHRPIVLQPTKCCCASHEMLTLAQICTRRGREWGMTHISPCVCCAASVGNPPHDEVYISET